MDVYVDLRCLQDPHYVTRGVGSHTASLLAHRGPFVPAATRVVGLVDPHMDGLTDAHAALVDEVRPSAWPRRPDAPAVFLQPSPMTHDPAPVGGLVGRPRILSAAVVYDFIP